GHVEDHRRAAGQGRGDQLGAALGGDLGPQGVEQPVADEAVVQDVDVVAAGQQTVVRGRGGLRPVAEAAGGQLQQGRLTFGEFGPPHGVAAGQVGDQDVQPAGRDVGVEGELVDRPTLDLNRRRATAVQRDAVQEAELV